MHQPWCLSRKVYKVFCISCKFDNWQKHFQFDEHKSWRITDQMFLVWKRFDKCCWQYIFYWHYNNGGFLRQYRILPEIYYLFFKFFVLYEKQKSLTLSIWCMMIKTNKKSTSRDTFILINIQINTVRNTDFYRYLVYIINFLITFHNHLIFHIDVQPTLKYN